jgi:hypothetical protein
MTTSTGTVDDAAGVVAGADACDGVVAASGATGVFREAGKGGRRDGRGGGTSSGIFGE